MVEDRTQKIDGRLTRLEVEFNHLRTVVTQLSLRFDALKGEVDALRLEMRDGFAAVALQFQKLRTQRMVDRLWWLAITASLLTVMARGFKWI